MKIGNSTGATTTLWKQNYFGLSGFFPLNYGSRYEHSVVVVPRDWNAMLDLIRAPQTFMETARASYGMGTPTHPLTGANAKAIPWTMEWPITILISPLTEATQKTRQLMNMLAGFYDFKSILTDWDNQSPEAMLSPTTFRNRVLTACAKTRANKVWSNPFPLQFIAEFAIDTRVLHITYVPRPLGTTSQLFERLITPATWSKITGTSLGFLHFDVDFGFQRTYADVADARAQIAMDYITNPEVLNTWLTRINMTPNPSKPPHKHTLPGALITGTTHYDPYGFYECDASLGEAGQLKKLGQAPLPSQAPHKFSRPKMRDVSVAIDSVWPTIPDKSALKALKRRNDIVTLSDDLPPAPYLCINITTDGDDAGNATEKWYQPPPPTPPTPGPSGGTQVAK